MQTVDELYAVIEELFDEHWEGEPLRLIGVSTSNLVKTKKVTEQLNLFNYQNFAEEEKLNQLLQKLKQNTENPVFLKGLRKVRIKMMNLEEKQVSTKTYYTNPFLKVTEDEVILPDQKRLNAS